MRYLFLRLAGIGLLGVATSAGATHFLVGVDPDTGESKIFVAAGVVNVRSNAPGQASGGTDEGTFVYPTQFMTLDPEMEAELAAQVISIVDMDRLASSIGPGVIEALVRNYNEISADNEAAIGGVLDRMFGGTGPAQSAEDRERLQANLDTLIQTLIQNSLDQVSLSADEIQAIIDQANSRGELPLPSPPPQSNLSEAERARQEAMRRLQDERRQAQQREMGERQRKQNEQRELLERIAQERERQAAANREAAEKRKQEAEEKYLQQLSELEQERLRNRLLDGGGGAPDLDPNSPATPESHQNHMDGVAGQGGSGAGGSAGGAGLGGSDDGSLAGGSGPAGELGGVHADYANQQQQDERIEEAAEELAALDPTPGPEPDPGPGPEPIDPWLGFLANNDGLYTDAFPSESIYGEAVGVYNGLVRGGFEDGGPSANGTFQMNIYFSDFFADGRITFDNDQGVMQFEGNVGSGFELWMEGNAFGGAANGHVYGEMYGPNGEEVGGTWGLNVLDGDFAGQEASGRFAAKQ